MLAALYEGDAKFEKLLPQFLPRREREPAPRYEMRKKEFHYRNYLGPIVDYFAALLFTSRPQPTAKQVGKEEVLTEPGDFYNEFRDDCDNGGTDVDAFFKSRFIRAMVEGRSWIRLHHATGDTQGLDKAQFEKLNLGDAWLEAVDYGNVLDWETDDEGNLEWAITHKKTKKRNGPGDSRGMVTESWDFLTPDAVQTFAISYDEKQEPAPTTEVPPIGEPESHRFGRVPLLCIDLPTGLWIASRLRTPQLAHFRASNAQSWSLAVTCYAQPVAKVQDPEAFSKTLLGAGYGVVIGIDESWEWEAPPTGHFAALDTEIKSHKDEIFRIAHQMALGVDNNSGSVGRSAESKATDAQSTRVMLVSFAKEVKEEMARVYDAISVSRGDDYTWTVGGLDEFASSDLMGFLESLEKLQTVGGIPSKTANALIKTRLAEGFLPDIDQETRATISSEIVDGVENEPTPEEKELQQFAAMHELANANAKPGGAGKAGGTKPSAIARGGKPNAGASAKPS